MKQNTIRTVEAEGTGPSFGNPKQDPPMRLNEREHRLALAIASLIPDLRWVMENSRPVNLQSLRNLLGLKRLAVLSMGFSALVPDEFWADLAKRGESGRLRRIRQSKGKGNRKGGI